MIKQKQLINYIIKYFYFVMTKPFKNMPIMDYYEQ